MGLSTLVNGGMKPTIGFKEDYIKHFKTLECLDIVQDSNKSFESYMMASMESYQKGINLSQYVDQTLESVDVSVDLIKSMVKKYSIEGIDPLAFTFEEEDNTQAATAKKKGFFKKMWEAIKMAFINFGHAVVNFVKSIINWFGSLGFKTQSKLYDECTKIGLEKVMEHVEFVSDKQMPINSTICTDEINKISEILNKIKLPEILAELNKVNDTDAIETVKEIEKTMDNVETFLKEKFNISNRPSIATLLDANIYKNLDKPKSEHFEKEDFEILSTNNSINMKNNIKVAKQLIATISKEITQMSSIEIKILKIAENSSGALTTAEASAIVNKCLNVANFVRRYSGFLTGYMIAVFGAYIKSRNFLYNALKKMYKYYKRYPTKYDDRKRHEEIDKESEKRKKEYDERRKKDDEEVLEEQKIRNKKRALQSLIDDFIINKERFDSDVYNNESKEYIDSEKFDSFLKNFNEKNNTNFTKSDLLSANNETSHNKSDYKSKSEKLEEEQNLKDLEYEYKKAKKHYNYINSTTSSVAFYKSDDYYKFIINFNKKYGTSYNHKTYYDFMYDKEDPYVDSEGFTSKKDKEKSNNVKFKDDFKFNNFETRKKYYKSEEYEKTKTEWEHSDTFHEFLKIYNRSMGTSFTVKDGIIEDFDSSDFFREDKDREKYREEDKSFFMYKLRNLKDRYDFNRSPDAPEFFDTNLFNAFVKQFNTENSTKFTKSDAMRFYNDESDNESKNSSSNDHYGEPKKDSRLIDAFKTLGLTVDATKEEVKSAYSKLIQKHHPDKFTSPEEISKATVITAKLNNARRMIYKFFETNTVTTESWFEMMFT